MAAKEDKFQQHKLTDMFARMKADAPVADPDMEDMGRPNRVPKINPALRHLATVTRKGKGKASAMIEEVVDEELPDYQVDWSGHLRVKRKQWRKQLEERAMARASGGFGGRHPANGTVTSMFRQRTQGLSSLAWEVISVSPTARPGMFNLWLSIDGAFQKLKLRVPRQFYLNLRAQPEKGTFLPQYQTESLVRTLPRNHPCQHLYRITVDEDLYVEGESHFSNLINNPNVDGVYELQVRCAAV